MSVQTSYDTAMPVAVAGMIADARDHVIESFAAEGADGIPFGYAVVAGTDAARQVKIPSTGGGVFRGVAIAEQAQEHAFPDEGDPVVYAEGDTVNVMRRGLVWVVTKGAVAIDAPAFFDNASTDAGKFDDLDDSSTDPVPGGVFRSATDGAGLALLELNLPQVASGS